MRTLIYKRTHTGDPSADGQFGIHDCMGSVRTWDFDSVIGVGGIGSEPASHGIAGKVTWIGIGPRARRLNTRGPIITFDHFCLFDSSGPSFTELAPQLAERMYLKNVRKVMLDGLDPEIVKILGLAMDAPPSFADAARSKAPKRCVAKCSSQKPLANCK